MTIDFNLIRSRLESYLTEDSIGIPVEYNNVNASASLQAAQKNKKPWCRVVIQEDDVEDVSVGSNPIRRYFGTLFIQFFDDVGQGTAMLRKYGSGVTNLLTLAAKQELFTDSKMTLWVRTPIYKDVGRDETEVWYQANVMCDLVYDMSSF